jgi:membrane protein implicated in regulation of membrane protease activity
MPDWLWWVIAGLVLVGVEIVTLDLLFLMLAGGAVVGAIATGVGAPPILAIGLAAATAVGLVGVVRPIALRHMRTPVALRSGVDALLGAEAIVVERVDSNDGRVKIGGEIWSARTYHPDGVHEAGERLNVMKIDGATALVG